MGYEDYASTWRVRDAKLKELGYPDWEAYTKSKIYKQTMSRAGFSFRCKLCHVCNCGGKVVPHYISYETLGTPMVGRMRPVCWKHRHFIEAYARDKRISVAEASTRLTYIKKKPLKKPLIKRQTSEIGADSFIMKRWLEVKAARLQQV